MISCSGLSFAYGNRETVRDFNLEVAPGETVMITGPNGAGKSTVLRLIAGVLRPSKGSVRYDLPEGVDPRSRMGYLPDSLSMYESMTPRQAAEFHGGIFGTPPSDLGLAREAGVSPDQAIRDLSLGQRVLVHLSIILSTGPEMILIDEVLHAVDPYLRELLFRELIGIMEKRRPAMVLVNLNFSQIEFLVDRVVFIGRSGTRLDESVEKLKARTRRVTSPDPPSGYTVVLSDCVMGRNRHVIYPFDEGASEGAGEFEEMDLTEIMTAFMGAEYNAT